MKLPWLKKILGFSVFLVCFWIFVQPVGAASWALPQEAYEQTLQQPTGESLETFSARSFLYYLHNLNLSISGSQTGATASASLHYSPGAIQLASGYVAQIISRPPASSVEYLADFGQRLHLVFPAYAQEGTGYQGLSGIMELWKVFRNIAYIFFVLIFVVVGFMIMFRAKLNPQTVVNLQLALPKLVVTLLLITFSYAIAGLILDLIYLSIYLATYVINTSIPSGINVEQFFSKNLLELIENFHPWGIADEFSRRLNELSLGGGITETFKTLLTSNILGVSIIQLIIGFAILFSILKLLLLLVLAYVNIILQVIFSPIILLLNALPQANTFSSWLKNLLANAASFPAAAILILVGSAIIRNTSDKTPLGSSFTPPFLNFFANSQQFVTNVIGIGFLLMMPQAIKLIQEALKAKGLPVGAAVGGALAAPLGLATQAGRFAFQEYQTRRMARAQKDAIIAAVRPKEGEKTGQTGQSL
jgi:hypothetical protein